MIFLHTYMIFYYSRCRTLLQHTLSHFFFKYKQGGSLGINSILINKFGLSTLEFTTYEW